MWPTTACLQLTCGQRLRAVRFVKYHDFLRPQRISYYSVINTRMVKLTLVIYMGVKTAPQIAEKLMEDGLSPDMPVAVIENGTRPDMRVLRGLLAGLPDLVEHEKVVSPALIVIGEVTARDDVALAVAAQEAAR